MVTIWVVTPHDDGKFDEWWGPSETDEDNVAALDYAQDRLEELWDQYDSADSRPVSVTIQQREVDVSEFNQEDPF